MISNQFLYSICLSIALILLIPSVEAADNTIPPTLSYTPPISNMTYWCRPIHYLGGPQGSWQRIDGGLYVNTTRTIDYAKVWIDASQYDGNKDELGQFVR